MIEIFKSDAHLWFARHDDFDTFKLKRTSLEWLTEIELIRLNRCYDERHRTQYILGRLLVRNVLSQYSYLEPWCWRFGENKFGKPILDPRHEQDLSFNLSHSGNCLVVAVSRSNELGVDIERSDKPRRVTRIARRYFANSEIEELFDLPDSEQLSRFYDLWTLKEAYTKARGFGLAIPFSQFSFAFSREKLNMSFSKSVDDKPSNWQIWQMNYTPYKIALAVKGDTEITNIVSRKFLTMTSHEFETSSIIRSTQL
tara:strand:- start:215 stop:979 length:765 start_codon:yes stop_codon:yes gene_type:complete